MNPFRALYDTYNYALDHGLVGRTENLNSDSGAPVLLPVYYREKRASSGKDIIEITLSSEGDFLNAEFLPKEARIIFPITEESTARSGTKATPHPLVDNLTYFTQDFYSYEDRSGPYLEALEKWYRYDQARDEPSETLALVYQYVKEEGRLFKDIQSRLFAGGDYSIKNKAFYFEVDDKSERLGSDVFVTFRIARTEEKDLTVSGDEGLREAHVNYTRHRLVDEFGEENFRYCYISGINQYCVDKHPGVFGNSKLIPVSKKESVYRGRFKEGVYATSIGYETSQKIFSMLNYLIDNRRTGWTTYDGDKVDKCYLVWSGDNVEKPPIDIFQGRNFNKASEEEGAKERPRFEEILFNPTSNQSSFHVGDETSRILLEQLRGYLTAESPRALDERYYVLILKWMNNGRTAIRYFRDLSLSDLSMRLDNWYASTNWVMRRNKRDFVQTPSLGAIVDYTYGSYDRTDKKVKIKTKKLKHHYLEQLIPCIIDGQALPINFAQQMMINVTKRQSYGDKWYVLLHHACSVLKKYKWDYKGERMSTKLQTENQSRSYLYGRLAAVLERIETTGKDWDYVSNVEKSWTNLMRYPGKTVLFLEEKVQPYKIKMKRDGNYYGRYNRLLEEIYVELGKVDGGHNEAVDEDFIFGYYAQREALFVPGKKKAEETDE